jgi:hypothetical protein
MWRVGDVAFWPIATYCAAAGLGRHRSKADVVTSHMTPPGFWVHDL